MIYKIWIGEPPYPVNFISTIQECLENRFGPSSFPFKFLPTKVARFPAESSSRHIKRTISGPIKIEGCQTFQIYVREEQCGPPFWLRTFTVKSRAGTLARGLINCCPRCGAAGREKGRGNLSSGRPWPWSRRTRRKKEVKAKRRSALGVRGSA